MDAYETQVVLPFDILRIIILDLLATLSNYDSLVNLLLVSKEIASFLTKEADWNELRNFMQFTRDFKKTIKYNSDFMFPNSIIMSIGDYVKDCKLKIYHMVVSRNIVELLSDLFISHSYVEYGGDEVGGDLLKFPFWFNLGDDLLPNKMYIHYLNINSKCQCKICNNISTFERKADKIYDILKDYHIAHDAFLASINIDDSYEVIIPHELRKKQSKLYDKWLDAIRISNRSNFLLCYEISGDKMIDVILSLLMPLESAHLMEDDTETNS